MKTTSLKILLQFSKFYSNFKIFCFKKDVVKFMFFCKTKSCKICAATIFNNCQYSNSKHRNYGQSANYLKEGIKNFPPVILKNYLSCLCSCGFFCKISLQEIIPLFMQYVQYAYYLARNYKFVIYDLNTRSFRIKQISCYNKFLHAYITLNTE